MGVGGREEGSSRILVSLWVHQAGGALSTHIQPCGALRKPTGRFRSGAPWPWNQAPGSLRSRSALRSPASSSAKRGFYEMLFIEDGICEMLRWVITF